MVNDDTPTPPAEVAPPTDERHWWIPPLAKALAVATYCVVVAGGAVTSTESGMADPHWPSFGGEILPSAEEMMTDRGLFYEHGHRFIAGLVLLSTWALTLVLYLTPARRSVRRLALASSLTGTVPAIFGGLTVLFNTPPVLSVVHVGMAMIFMSLNASLAVCLGRGWTHSGQGRAPLSEAGEEAVASLAKIAFVTTASIYAQIILGAFPRHAYRGEIPHILWAFVVFAVVVLVAARVLRWQGFESQARPRGVAGPAALLLILVVVQFVLGVTAYVTRPETAEGVASRLNEIVASIHQAAGALMLVASVVLTLRVWRWRYSRAGGTAAAVQEVAT